MSVEHPIRNEVEAMRRAKFHAGLILESVLGDGWGSDPDRIEKYGVEGAAMVEAALTDLAEKLVQGVRVG